MQSSLLVILSEELRIDDYWKNKFYHPKKRLAAKQQRVLELVASMTSLSVSQHTYFDGIVILPDGEHTPGREIIARAMEDGKRHLRRM
jgi:hypothetical protein